MSPSCLKDINLNTTLKYPDFFVGEQSEEQYMAYVLYLKTRADRGKLVLFLESAGQIYPETGLTFEAPKCVLANVNGVFVGFSHIFLLGISIFKGLTVQCLYKSFGIKGLMLWLLQICFIISISCVTMMTG
jgi:hypothetical protein